MDKILIKNLHVRSILGVYDWERDTPRDVIINLELETDTTRAAKSDRLQDCVDYDALAKKIRALAEKARRATVEALAEDIATLCLDQPLVKSVLVRVEKPGAIAEADSAGAEILRRK